MRIGDGIHLSETVGVTISFGTIERALDPLTALFENNTAVWPDTRLGLFTLQAPEVQSAAGKLGRAETATDPAPVEMIETTIMLKPDRQWPAGTTKASIIADLSAKLMNVPGYVPGFLQPIENRVLMTSTGIRAQVGVKLFGDNLDALQQKAFEIERVINRVQGATGVGEGLAAGLLGLLEEVVHHALEGGAGQALG